MVTASGMHRSAGSPPSLSVAFKVNTYKIHLIPVIILMSAGTLMICCPVKSEPIYLLIVVTTDGEC